MKIINNKTKKKYDVFSIVLTIVLLFISCQTNKDTLENNALSQEEVIIINNETNDSNKSDNDFFSIIPGPKTSSLPYVEINPEIEFRMPVMPFSNLGMPVLDFGTGEEGMEFLPEGIFQLYSNDD